MLVITTSFNLVDGVDGLSSGLALISAVSFAVAGYLFGQPLVVALSLVLSGAVLAFLRYNFPPAKILMGDSGSLFLGLLFGTISLVLLVPGRDVFYTAAGSVVILSIPLLDTILAFCRRLFTNQPIFHADLCHLHHILLYRFKSVKKVDFLLWSLSAVFGLLGVFTMMGNLVALGVAVIVQAVVFVVALHRMVRFELSKERVEEILYDCGVKTSRVVPRGE